MPKAAILGAKNSGKSTVFSILTGISGQKSEERIWGEAPVPDSRLERLSDLFKPKKTTRLSFSLLDFRNDGASVFQYTPLDVIKCEVLLFVLRCFEDQSVYYPFGESLDPLNEYSELTFDLAFKDLEILEKREKKIHSELKSAKKQIREKGEQELSFISSLKGALEEGHDLRKKDFSGTEQAFLKNYNLISLKKRLIILNENNAFSEEKTARLQQDLNRRGETVLQFDGKLELEMQALSPEERNEWKTEMGIEEFSSELIQKAACRLLDLICFFTVGEDECRAWAVSDGTGARKAAGTIHSDLEKGFIRAEIVSYEDMLQCGSMAEAKKRRLMRLEGADYIVRDGEIMHVRFNV